MKAIDGLSPNTSPGKTLFDHPLRFKGQALSAHVGDRLLVTLHDGTVVDATVRAIVDGGEKLQVDFGREETDLVKASQVVVA
jgi:hypothetical protein